MRYVRWIVMLLILIVIILQIFYNFKNFTESTFVYAFQLLPAKELFRIELPVWQGLLIMFLLGFGMAILFEVYYWFKYTMTIRSQNKLIKKLQDEVIALRPLPAQSEPAPEAKSKDKPAP
jgi:uncharacterized membrane protein YciS (DUF1049 family)